MHRQPSRTVANCPETPEKLWLFEAACQISTQDPRGSYVRVWSCNRYETFCECVGLLDCFWPPVSGNLLSQYRAKARNFPDNFSCSTHFVIEFLTKPIRIVQTSLLGCCNLEILSEESCGKPVGCALDLYLPGHFNFRVVVTRRIDVS